MQQQTLQLLQQIQNNTITLLAIAQLKDVLRYHELQYYVHNKPTITDYEYDQLYHTLVRLENENAETITPDSPTQRVASGLIDRKRVV